MQRIVVKKTKDPSPTTTPASDLSSPYSVYIPESKSTAQIVDQSIVEEESQLYDRQKQTIQVRSKDIATGNELKGNINNVLFPIVFLGILVLSFVIESRSLRKKSKRKQVQLTDLPKSKEFINEDIKQASTNRGVIAENTEKIVNLSEQAELILFEEKQRQEQEREERHRKAAEELARIRRINEIEHQRHVLEHEQYIKDIQSKRINAGNSRTTGYNNGYEYENYIAGLLAKNGYTNVRVTKGSGDGGADIICTDTQGRKCAVQCKMYNSGPVGYKAVQEVYAGKGLYQCDIAIVITNSYFSEPAKQKARQLGVILYEKVC